MTTTEKLFHWSGAIILSGIILSRWLGWLDSAAAVRLLPAGVILYTMAFSRYTRRLRAENAALKQQLSTLHSSV